MATNSQTGAKNAEKEDKNSFDFALTATNYYLMIAGFCIIVLGFALMIGGGSDDPEVFNEEIYDFRHITLAPMVVLCGFIFEIYAIMTNAGDKKEDKQ